MLHKMSVTTISIQLLEKNEQKCNQNSHVIVNSAALNVALKYTIN